MFLARLLSRKTIYCAIKFYPIRGCLKMKSNISAISNQFDLDCPEMNEMKYKLTNQLKLPTEKANLILLKWINTEQIDNNRLNLDEKINLFLQYLKVEDIVHNLHIFNMDIDKFRNGMYFFSELGFDNIEVKLLDNISTLMKKNVEDLKSNNVYPDKNMVNHICNYLRTNFQLSIKNNFTEKLQNIDDSFNLKQIRETFQHVILNLFLNCSDQVSLEIKISFINFSFPFLGQFKYN